MDLVHRSPPNKKAKLSAGLIEHLPEPLLVKIFSYLPLKDRYLLVLVSAKWAAASRVPWTDVTSLNLASIPGAMADPILGLCPRLATIEAKDHTIVLETAANLPDHEHVRTLTFRNVKFAGKGHSPLIASDAANRQEVFERSRALITQYFASFPKLTDLTLIDCEATHSPPQMLKSANAEVAGMIAGIMIAGLPFVHPGEMSASLKRLVLSRPPGSGAYAMFANYGMENAECVYLADGISHRYTTLVRLPLLRELCLVGGGYGFGSLAKRIASGEFPQLKVLVYASNHWIDRNSLAQLMTAKIALRILVIAGKRRKR